MDNLGFGLSITVAGMGTVFLLLLILMAALLVIRWSDGRARVVPADAAAAVAASEVTGTTEEDDPGALTEDEIAAITIAVITHARVRRLQAAPEMRAHLPGSHLFANRWVGIGRSHQQQPWTRGN